MTNLPYVGQPLSYYPDEKTRLAAICTEVNEGDGCRINLAVFQKDGKQIAMQNVEYVDQEAESEQPDLEGRWSMLHEFPVNQAPDSDGTSECGTESNEWVGQLSLQ